MSLSGLLNVMVSGVHTLLSMIASDKYIEYIVKYITI